ncbi:flagellar assembly protein FliW [Kiloniella majae]|uniref:flagellar assembly protein FliW n=1 Tax=Kiloniella majae TaxID=1938558 RepID=UPI000A27789C|nr:flagellar assembly protein FliW [Kiloniella majae]
MLDLETNYKAQNFAGITMPKTEEVSNNIITLKTRFGVMEIDRDKTIKMPKGMVGFSEYKEFGLSTPSHAILNGSMLLQAINEADLTFILTPYNINSNLLSEKDIANVMKQYSISPNDIAIMLVTTLRQMGDTTQKTVNLRAPLFISTSTRQAWQHILNSENYDIRHKMN